MTDSKGVSLFFSSFEQYLERLLAESVSDHASQLAKVMRAQLEHFRKATLDYKNPSHYKDLFGIEAFLSVQDSPSFFDWLIDGQKVANIDYCLYLADVSTWRVVMGDPPGPDHETPLEWIESGKFGKKEKDGFVIYHFFIAGQLRLILSFSKKTERWFQSILKMIYLGFSRVTGPLSLDIVNYYSHSQLVAHDEKSLNLLQQMGNAAHTDVTILIEGESGTGKEVFANFVHLNSKRKSKNFVAVNCAAIPEGLIESELFGHEKGAFTGAVQRHVGKVEMANGGTLFLDEIGEMDLKVQAKLLRFLQLKEFHRVGGKEKITVDVRIVAATNKNLRKAIENQLFRDDLYFRLSVMPFKIPPLRERPGDIVPLFHHFLRHYSAEFNMELPNIQRDVYEVLFSHPFLGNVRELENLAQNLLVQSQGQEIERKHLASFVAPQEGQNHILNGPILYEPMQRDLDAKTALITPDNLPRNNEELKQAKNEILEKAKQVQLDLEKEFLMNLLKQVDWNIPEASKSSGINRTMLYKMMDRTGIKE